jgi:Circularly permutated YpsA SLOG family
VDTHHRSGKLRMAGSTKDIVSSNQRLTPIRSGPNATPARATVILSLSDKLSGGSALTVSYARQANKPVLYIHNSETGRDPLPSRFASSKTLSNKTRSKCGPRESNEPGVYRFTLQILEGTGRNGKIDCNVQLAVPEGVGTPEIILSIACECLPLHNAY